MGTLSSFVFIGMLIGKEAGVNREGAGARDGTGGAGQAERCDRAPPASLTTFN